MPSSNKHKEKSPVTGKVKAVGIVVALLGVLGMVFAQVGQASSGSTTVSGSPTGGSGAQLVTLTAVGQDDNGTSIIYNFTTSNTVDATSFDHTQWDLDMNSNGSTTDAVDGCIQMSAAGSVLRAALLPGCAQTTALTADATITPSGSGDVVQISFNNQQWRNALGFTGTSYQYRFTSVDADGWTYVVPSSSGFITHSNVSPAATPTPTPTATPIVTPTPTPCTGCQTASATQNQQVNVSGVLSISALQSLVDFGSVSTGGSKSNVGAGELDYTNTLSDTPPAWNVTVQSSNLTRSSGGTLGYTNETFTPGSTIASGSGSSGTPTAGSAGAFQGTGSTSNPVTVATAASGTYGSFQQTGDAVSLNVPLATKPGLYSGTLTYTITG
jgi:hypothetical protein